ANTDPVAYCKPYCPVPAGTTPDQICRPCPYAQKLPTGEIKYCCPVATATTANVQLWCRPCPVAETGKGGPAQYCCPVPQVTAAGEALWCRPCPLATGVDDQVQMWCCPLPDVTVQGNHLWCRPCPLAVQVDENVQRWCCPIAQAEAAGQSLWCKPCPYAVEKNGQLTLYCCPVASDVDNVLWCRPCPYPKATDRELTPYCCPIATNTGQDLWCKPCPLANGVDDILKQWCCPLPTVQVDSDILWCRPCPFAQNVDGGIIRYCCPVAQMPDSDLTLWCKPCPLATNSQPAQVCCPISTAEAAGDRLWCCPVSHSSPVAWCRPYVTLDSGVRNGKIYYPYSFIPQKGCVQGDSGALDIEDAQGMTQDEVKIPVRIQTAPGSVYAIGFEVIYNPDVLEYLGFERGNLVTSFTMVDVNPDGSDRVRVGGMTIGNGIPQGATGYVVWLKFKVTGDIESGCTPVLLENLTDDLAQFSQTGGCFCMKDNIPPEIACPKDRIIAQTSLEGTPADDPDVLDFLAEASAWDNLDGEVEVTYNILLASQSGVPASTSAKPYSINEKGIKASFPAILPPGTTNVIFTAVDSSGNSASCVSTITVQPIACEEDESGELDIEGTTGKMGKEVVIPVRIQSALGTVSAFGFEVTYKPSVLEYTGYERGNLVTSFPMFEVNSIGSGRLIVGGFSAVQGISQGASGTVVLLKFMVKGGMEGGCYPLMLENLTDDLAQFFPTPGCICINSCNGDLNGDGKITPKDALIAFQCYLGSGPCDDCTDVNGDGKTTPSDALCLFKKYLGQPSCLDDLTNLP
ncbi:MAG: cohesin domain-containing protein, partial [bacterium]